MHETVLFFGTPTFAVPSLRALFDAGYRLICVTAPDRPAGRGHHLRPSPVKEAALTLRLPVLQPEKLDAGFLSLLSRDHFAVGVVVAYGKILPPSLLRLPERSMVNVHFSLLPKYRGASPVAAALLAGDEETGITIMQLDEGLDTGPLLAQQRVPIAAQETTGMLTERLAEKGAELLLSSLREYLDGTRVPQPQDSSNASYAPRLTKQDGRISWSEPAALIVRKVHALTPWPGAWTFAHGERLAILQASVGSSTDAGNAPGTIVAVPEGIGVVAGDGRVVTLDAVQAAGKKPTSGRDFLNGHQALISSVLDAAQREGAAITKE